MKYYYVHPGSTVIVVDTKDNWVSYRTLRLNDGMMFSPTEMVEYQYPEKTYVFQTMTNIYYVNEGDLDSVN